MRIQDGYTLGLYFFAWSLVNTAMPLVHDIALELHTQLDAVRWSITLFMAVFAASQMVWGVLSDRFGRRAILRIGFVVGVAGAVITATADTFAMYCVGQVVLGLSAGSCPGVGRSVFVDQYNGKVLAGLMSILTIVIAVTPAIAAFISVHLDHWFGWRAAFVYAGILALCMAGYALFVLRETHFSRTTSLHPRHIALALRACLLNREFVCGAVLFGLVGGFALGAVYPALPILLLKHLAVTKLSYSHWLLLPALAYLLGGVAARVMVKRFELLRCVRFGIALQCSVFMIACVWVAIAGTTVLSVMLPMSMAAFSMSSMTSVVNSLSMLAVKEHRGMAGSLVGLSVAAMSTIFSAVVALFSLVTVWPLLAVLAVTIVLVIAIFKFGFRHQ